MIQTRHALYWAFITVVFIPFMISVLGHVAYEFLDGLVMNVRTWCYRERYVARDRS